jgi:hypothetical protein
VKRLAGMLLAALLIVAAGCGGKTAIDARASDQLTAAVARVRAAARDHDVAGAGARLDDLRRIVLLLRANGDLTDAAAGRILAAADGVGSDLRLIPTTTSTTTISPTTTTPNPPSPPPPRPDKRHHGKGDGND